MLDAHRARLKPYAEVVGNFLDESRFAGRVGSKRVVDMPGSHQRLGATREEEQCQRVGSS